jgi:hypothetical protein
LPLITTAALQLCWAAALLTFLPWRLLLLRRTFAGYSDPVGSVNRTWFRPAPQL